MVRGRVILGGSSATEGSKPLNEPLKDQPQLHWTLQLPGRNNILFDVIYDRNFVVI